MLMFFTDRCPKPNSGVSKNIIFDRKYTNSYHCNDTCKCIGLPSQHAFGFY